MAVVNVSRNFAYEDSHLNEAPGYLVALSTIDALNYNDPMLDDIIDSHDLVQYIKELMNVEAASKLAESSQGIFRYLQLK